MVTGNSDPEDQRCVSANVIFLLKMEGRKESFYHSVIIDRIKVMFSFKRKHNFYFENLIVR